MKLYSCWLDGKHKWTRWIPDPLRPVLHRWCTCCHTRQRKTVI